MPQERCSSRKAAAKRTLPILRRVSLSVKCSLDRRAWPSWYIAAQRHTVYSLRHSDLRSHTARSDTGWRSCHACASWWRVWAFIWRVVQLVLLDLWAFATSMLRNITQRRGVGQENRRHISINMCYLNILTNRYNEVNIICFCRSSSFRTR